MSNAKTFPVKIERLDDFFPADRLVDPYLTHTGEQREIDPVALVLLVVRHQLVKRLVVLAAEEEGLVIAFHVINHLPDLFHREGTELVREVKLADDTGRDGMPVQDGVAFLEREAFVSVPDRVAEIQGFADASFLRVLVHDPFLYGDRLGHQLIQVAVVHRVDVVKQDRRVVRHGTDQGMLDHLGITGEDVVPVQRAKELAVDKDAKGGIERANLVLQAIEIDPRLAADRRVDRGHQRRGDIHGPDPSLESRSGEPAQIGHHASSQVEEEGMAGRPLVGEASPDGRERIQALVRIARLDRDHRRFRDRLYSLY